MLEKSLIENKAALGHRRPFEQSILVGNRIGHSLWIRDNMDFGTGLGCNFFKIAGSLDN